MTNIRARIATKNKIKRRVQVVGKGGLVFKKSTVVKMAEVDKDCIDALLNALLQTSASDRCW